MKPRQVVVFGLIVTLFLGCSARKSITINDYNSTLPASQAKKYTPHNRPVLLTKTSLPATVQYEVLAQLEVGKQWYGSSKDLYQSMADGARAIGADVVIDFKIWYQPTGWSWAAPHASGIGIKLLDLTTVDLRNIDGTWK